MTPFALAYTAWRHTRGLTHREVGALLGVSPRTSEAYAQGQHIPEPDVLATLRRLGFVPPPFIRRGPGRPESHP